MQARYVNDGETVVFKATTDIEYDDIVKVGDNLVGVATTAIAKGDTGVVAITGAYEVAKAKVTLKQGQAVYYKDSDKNVTATQGDGPQIGVTLTDAKTDTATVIVKLLG